MCCICPHCHHTPVTSSMSQVRPDGWLQQRVAYVYVAQVSTRYFIANLVIRHEIYSNRVQNMMIGATASIAAEVVSVELLVTFSLEWKKKQLRPPKLCGGSSYLLHRQVFDSIPQAGWLIQVLCQVDREEGGCRKWAATEGGRRRNGKTQHRSTVQVHSQMVIPKHTL